MGEPERVARSEAPEGAVAFSSRLVFRVTVAALVIAVLGAIAMLLFLDGMDRRAKGHMRRRHEQGQLSASLKAVLHQVDSHLLAILRAGAVDASAEGEFESKFGKAISSLETMQETEPNTAVLEALRFRTDLVRGLLDDCRLWRCQEIDAQSQRDASASMLTTRAEHVARQLRMATHVAPRLGSSLCELLARPAVARLEALPAVVADTLAAPNEPLLRDAVEERLRPLLSRALEVLHGEPAAAELHTSVATCAHFAFGGGPDQLGGDGLVGIQQRGLELRAERERLEGAVTAWKLGMLDDLAVFENAANRATFQASERLHVELRSTVVTLVLLGCTGAGLFVLLAWWVGRAAAQQIGAWERARAAAQEAALSKSRFLANMSHEIRTPMNGILGMVDLLAETRVDGEQAQYVRTIQQSAHALLTIINDILDYSKIEAGKLTLDAAEFDVRETVSDCLDLLTPIAHGKGIELVPHFDPQVPLTMIGDGGRLRQVLLNLIGNAVKFTSEGEVFVMVEHVADAGSAGNTVRFSVMDTGIGIPPDAQQRLFQPFAQADGSTTRRFGGTGLGLAISRRLVGLMGGELRLHSRPGVGSTFWFDVTLSVGKCVAQDPHDLSAASVLIVDDNETSRQVLAMQLAPTRVGLDLAADLPQALSLLRLASSRGQPFSLVLLDITAPQDDGIALVRQLRGAEGFPQPRLVVLTGLGARPAAADLATLHVAACVSKPVREQRLLEAVREALGADSSEGPTAVAVPEAPRVPSVTLDLDVLVAEDNAINRRVIGSMLEKLGCRPLFASNGREAVDLQRRSPCDVVLMDCQMPEMDGYEASRAIRAQETGRRVPILALTANVLPSDREACLHAGMDDFLTKPVQKQVLADALRRATAQSTRAQRPTSLVR